MKLKHISALTLSALLLFSAAGCGAQEQEEAAPAGVAVQVESVSRGPIANEHIVSGQLAADNQSVITMSTPVKCTAVYYSAGDTVSAGDILCTLDLESTLASYNAASISYASAVQSYEDQSQVFAEQISLYEKNLADLKALYDIGAASQMEIDQAQLQLQSAIATRNSTLAQLESGMENARSGLEQLDTALENVDSAGNVIAPISGVLASLTAVENSFVSTAAPLAVIDDASQMKITVSVSEALVPQLSIGDKADVTVSAAGASFSAVIRSVDQTANPQTKLYSVTLDVPQETTGLLSGMFADATFRTGGSEDAVVIPTEAILTSGDDQYVYIVENDTAKQVAVKTGIIGSGVTEITDGLSGGESLVTVGQSYLHDGDAVRVVTGEA